MKLHRLAVRNFKGITEREVTFPDAGVLVLEGPNEVGKTSMLEALDLLLEHKDSSRRAEIRAAQPVGQDVAPSVEVEMSTGPYRFTYRKQWRKQPRTELDVTSPRRLHLTGDEAHARAGQMLAETTDLHLWRALRLLQATPLLPADFSDSSALASALDAAAGSAHDAGPAGESLLAAAEAVYLRYFTAKNAQPTGEYRASIGRLAAAEEGVTVAQRSLDEVATDVALHDRLVLEGAGCAERLDSARDALTELESLGSEIDGLDEARRLAVAARDEAAREVTRHGERVAERRELAASVAARDEAVGLHEQALTELRAGLEPMEARLVELIADDEDARTRQEQARVDLEQTQTRAELARDRAEWSALAARIDKIDAAARARAKAEAALDDLPVTDSVWDDIEAASRALDVAEAARAAGGASVRLSALAPGQRVRLGGDDVAVDPGDDRVVTLDEPVTFSVPGALEVHFQPEAGASERVAAVRDARARLVDLLRGVGVSTVEQAREARGRRRDTEAERRRADDTLRDVLDGDDRGALIDRREALHERLARHGLAPDANEAKPTPRPTRRGSRTRAATPADASAVLFDVAPAEADAPAEVAVDAQPGSAAEGSAPAAACADGLAGGGNAGGKGEEPAHPTGQGETPAHPTGQGETPAHPTGQGDAPRSGATGAVGPAVAHTATATSVTDPAAASDRIAKARRVEHEARAAATRAAARLATARADADRLRIESARAESLLAAVHRESTEQRARLDSLRAARSDDDLERDLTSAESALAAAENELDAAVERLRGCDVEGVRDRLTAVRAELPALERRRREIDDDRIRVEARLEQAGQQGRNEALDAALSEREHSRRVHDGHRRHAEAARLLHSTLQEQSHAAKQAYVRPFTEAIARFGRIVYGPDFDVEVDDGLRIEARILGGRRIPYAALSSGAKEQLAIITRLACATLVDAERGAPVVIDDALGYSDPDKLRRVCAAFARLGADAQVLLLTCTPGRYAAIGDAHVVRL